MACRVTQGERVHMAIFADENSQKGRCARDMEKINDLLLPQGLHLARMDFRFLTSPEKEKVKKVIEQQKPLDAGQQAKLKELYTLPRAAMQGLSITAKQPMSVLDAAPVEERLGPFARNHDGGKLVTSGEGVGEFPRFFCNVSGEEQPFKKLQVCQAEDGTSTNIYHSLLWGSGVYYFALVAGFCRVDVQCDTTTGWRVVHRGDIPFGLQLRPGMKQVTQIIGPERWIPTVVDESELFSNEEISADV